MKRILTLDGGGIHGFFTLEVLEIIESLLRSELKAGPDFRLRHYFDMIGGTSTGAIIASFLAWGMSVAEVRKLYEDNAEVMFRKNPWYLRPFAKFTDRAINCFLESEFREDGSPALLGSERLLLGSDRKCPKETLLLVVLKNGTTGSPWPLTNHRSSKYNDRSTCGEHSNLNIPLWQIVRASTAAPTYFPPQRIQIGGRDFEFIDGGMTPFNNPSCLAYLMATLPEYRINFAAGEKELLLVSVGTGQRDLCYAKGQIIHKMHHLSHAKAIIKTLLAGAAVQQDLLCRVHGACRFGEPLDTEVGALHANASSAPKAFTYLRYNYRYLDTEVAPVLRRLRCDWQLDSLKLIDFIKERGKAYARTAVCREHFTGFV